MADAIEHPILEKFCAMRNQVGSLQSEMSSEFADVKYHINRLENAVAGIRRDEAGQEEDIARQQAYIDRLMERVQRIERRLELREE